MSVLGDTRRPNAGPTVGSIHFPFPASHARIQDSERGGGGGGGGFVQEFRLENRSYPDVHDFSFGIYSTSVN